MKITTTIEVTPQQYFNHLCSTVIEDVKKKTDKNVTIKDLLDGYYYERSVSVGKKTTTVKLNVGPLIRDKYFAVKYETNDTQCYYYYDFSSKDGQNYVTYCEENNYKEETVGNYVSNLRRKLTEKSLKMKVLNNIELTQTYIKNHEGE